MLAQKLLLKTGVVELVDDADPLFESLASPTETSVESTVVESANVETTSDPGVEGLGTTTMVDPAGTVAESTEAANLETTSGVEVAKLVYPKVERFETVVDTEHLVTTI